MAAVNVSDFLKPESMMTPGIAGSVAMMITNSLYLNFEMDQKLTCLALSFVLGGMVFVAKNAGVLKRVVYYVLNSLIIFSVAAGSNVVGAKLTAPDTHASYEFRIISSAHADEEAGQEQQAQASDDEAKTDADGKSPADRTEDSSRKDASDAPAEAPSQDRKFFSAW